MMAEIALILLTFHRHLPYPVSGQAGFFHSFPPPIAVFIIYSWKLLIEERPKRAIGFNAFVFSIAIVLTFCF